MVFTIALTNPVIGTTLSSSTTSVVTFAWATGMETACIESGISFELSAEMLRYPKISSFNILPFLPVAFTLLKST